MKLYFFFAWSVLVLFTACNEAGSGAASTSTESISVGDYELEPISGSDCQLAIKKNTAGLLEETGLLCNGQRYGAWSFYGTEQTFPLKLVTYVNGNYNGTYLEFNDRGQIALLATYKDNVLHGPWGKYRFGRPEMEANYVDGELEGVYREYDFRNGVMKKEVSYKAGKEDGVMRFFDEEGNVVLEYMYRNGERVNEQISAQSGASN